LISVRHPDKPAFVPIARRLVELGFHILATKGTAKVLRENGILCTKVNKISEGRPHIKDKIQDKEIQWIINTSMGTRTTEDSYIIRRCALDYHLPYTTTLAGAISMVDAIATFREQGLTVKALQEYHC